ncbi:tRNA (5-methylaminomethyl-2-thiouridine)(34)-methyltransferase MnmD [Rhodovulum sp. DZ06]|uniref:tRNA (5-methylaminomethyl-2-thiouridine)(34)-methyltransferase MnmD n=1 Tax=Rhodovulum sp. DZ06 TaxID=3425126 RepID=UPI003D3458E2
MSRLQTRPQPPAQSPAAASPAAAPDLSWRAGAAGAVPVSELYDDPYYSVTDGLAETRYNYLEAAGLPARMAGAEAFHIGELGFGAGLATLAAWEAWRKAGDANRGTLHVTSFELHPMAAADMARAHAAFPELAALSAEFLPAWAAAEGEAERRIALPGLSLRVVLGDARVTVPRTRLLAQAWFLDGFDPRRNPALWEPALLCAVARRTAPGGTATSYTAAGHVRRALSAAGFEVTRRPGFGTKRHMTVARLRPEGAA